MLKDFREDDITERYIGWLNDQDVVRFSSQRFIFHDRTSCLDYLLSFEKSDGLFLLIERIDTGSSIGTLSAGISKRHGTADIGILIGEKSIWGCGYGQDAWNTLLHWCEKRDGIRKISAGTLVSNRGMIKLMERSGMKLEAIRTAQEILGGEPEDVCLYAKFV